MEDLSYVKLTSLDDTKYSLSHQDATSRTEDLNYAMLSSFDTKRGLSHQYAMNFDPSQDATSRMEDLNYATLSSSDDTKRGLSRQDSIYFDFLLGLRTEELNNASSLSLDNTKQSKRGLSRQNAIYFDSDCKFHDVEDKFDVINILVKLDAKHPHLNFLQYEEALQKLKIYYLETANFFEPHFYQSHFGMSDEAAELFRQIVSKEYAKALLEHERGKMRRRGKHNTVPVFFS